jgi:hypothetical protein
MMGLTTASNTVTESHRHTGTSCLVVSIEPWGSRGETPRPAAFGRGALAGGVQGRFLLSFPAVCRMPVRQPPAPADADAILDACAELVAEAIWMELQASVQTRELTRKEEADVTSGANDAPTDPTVATVPTAPPE